jgi:site-specific DNA-methyltransferase (adenine-specific)
MQSRVILTQGECLREMADIPDGYVDMVLCDLPYGTTQNKWDTCIDLVSLWAQYKRICKGAVVLTAAQPFTSVLVCSNLKDFKYQWVWEKDKATGHLNAKKQPMRSHEDVLVFWQGIQKTYNPQMGEGKPYSNSHKAGDSGDCYGKVGVSSVKDCTTRYPRTVFRMPVDSKAEFHSTQKPVALMEYMVKTYTNEGMTVLDNCMGSGTTGVACANLGRNFVGIEQDPEYFKIAKKRIDDARKQMV